MRGRKEKSAVISFDRIRTGYQKPSARERAAAELGLWLVQVLCIFLTAAGALRWIVTALELPYPATVFWPGTFAGAALFLTVQRSRGGLRWALRVLLLAAAAGFFLLMGDELALGARQLWNSVADRVQDYYGRQVGSFLLTGEQDARPLLFGAAGVFLTWILSWGIGRGGGKAAFRGILGILAVFSLCLDVFPDITAAVMLFCACAGIRTVSGAVLQGRFSAMLGLSGAVVMISTCGMLLAVYLGIIPRISEFFVDNHESAMDLQQQMEKRAEGVMRDLASGQNPLFGPLSWSEQVESGTLSNNAPRRTGETDLMLRAGQQPGETLLLRGFVGGTYKGNRWEEISEGGFEEAVLEQWEFSQETGQDGLVERVQQELFFVPGSAAAERSQVMFQLDLSDTDEDYGYLPYFAEVDGLEGNSIAFQADGEILRTRDTITFTGHSVLHEGTSQQGEDFAPQAEGQPDGEQETADRRFREEFLENYDSYVKVNYLSVPDQGMDRLRSLCSRYRAQMESGEMSLERAAVLVRSLLAAQCKYSMNLEPLPAGEDYVDYFLFEQKMGFCTHFASAGTLMFRMLGIPARYVTGYSVSPEEFTGTYEEYLEAQVTDYDAHAWVEIYDPQTGWIPVEVTPGYAADTVTMGEPDSPVATPPQEEPDVQDTSAAEGPEEQEDTQGGEGSEEDQEAAGQTQEESEAQEAADGPGEQTGASQTAQRTDRGMMVRTAAGAAAVLAVMAAVYLNGLRKRRRRARLFNQRDARKSVLALAAELSEMIEHSRLLEGRDPGDSGYCAAVCEKLPEIDREGFSRFMDSAGRAKFSREELTQEEVRAGRALFQAVNMELYRRLRPFGKLWWKYGRGY